MKKVKILLIIIVSLLGCYLGYNIFTIIKYSHGVEMDDYKPYMWVFNDSVKKDVDTTRFVGHTRERDILFRYRLQNNYVVSIWELKDLNGTLLHKIPINSNVDFSDVQIMPYELLNKYESPEITVELGFSINGAISLNLDNNSKIIKTIETPKYKGFYGIVNKMSISNDKGKHLIIFDYTKENEPTVFLFYKTTRSFYIIFINSLEKVPIDENVINLLNLS